MKNKKLEELQNEGLNESSNYELCSQEGTRVITNLKTIHDMQRDIEEAELKAKEMELRDQRERDRIEAEAVTERMRIEADERKSKRESRTKISLGVLMFVLTIFGIREDEVRPAMKKVESTVRTFIKI